MSVCVVWKQNSPPTASPACISFHFFLYYCDKSAGAESAGRVCLLTGTSTNSEIFLAKRCTGVSTFKFTSSLGIPPLWQNFSLRKTLKEQFFAVHLTHQKRICMNFSSISTFMFMTAQCINTRLSITVLYFLTQGKCSEKMLQLQAYYSNVPSVC